MPLNKLFLFTQSYPFGSGEVFIEKEINILAQHFSVVVIPMEINGEQRPVPAGVQVETGAAGIKVNSIGILLSSGFAFWKEFRAGTRHRQLSPKTLSYLRSWLMHKFALAKWLNKLLKEYPSSNPVFYTYWMADWTTSLAVAGTKKKGRVISRAHGFDLYEERRKLGFTPFRDLQFRGLDRVFCVSKMGEEYLKKRFPDYAQKVSQSYLGVHDHGINPGGSSDNLVLVSCSNLIPLKRVNLIVEALAQITDNITWYHFGDGPLLSEIKEMVKSLPGNIHAELKGNVSNRELMEFYQSTPVNLFLNVSESEGIPVSIMEAISFGIPVLATSVGGVPEIVTDKTGSLLPAALNPEQLASAILTFVGSDKNQPAFRKEVRSSWESNFNAAKNYTEFCERVKQIHSPKK